VVGAEVVVLVVVGAVVVVVVVGAVVVVGEVLVVVGVVGAVVVDVVVGAVVVGVLVVVVWFLRFHPRLDQRSVEDHSVVAALAEVSPTMLRVPPWAVKAPAIATRTAAWRSGVAKRAPVQRRRGDWVRFV
jgi:hypothetical protein